VPEQVQGRHGERVLRAPAAGVLETQVEIGAVVVEGQPLASVAGQVLAAPFDGVLRGLLYPGLKVEVGQKIGDLDPRSDPLLCTQISDKSLAVGGGVLEAILSRPEIRPNLWK
jgi:xanthine dehydrogenase accessory factor